MKYLTKEDMNREWSHSDDVLKMRRAFALIMHEDPVAFETCVREFMEYGADRFPYPGKSKPGTPEHARKMLLAEYRLAQKRGITKDEFLESEAERGVRGADQYVAFRWNNAETIRTQLREAQKAAKEDKEFEEGVEFYVWAFDKMGGSRSR